ncbi:MAG: deoxyribonuclease IV [Elusimicrobiota bacterium]
MRLGLHCDVRGGYPKALQRAQDLKCEAFQIITYKRHHRPNSTELAAFRSEFAKSSVRHLVCHVRYLPGLASKDSHRRSRSVEFLKDELSWSDALGAEYLVFHLGAYSVDATKEDGMKWAAKAVSDAVALASARKVQLVLETVPGGGRRMGGSLEELAEFAKLIQGPKLRFCLDTAHAWAQGYEMDTREGVWRFLGRAHKLLGAENIPVFHLNDSQAHHGSHREHHAHWGEGRLGTEGLKALLERDDHKEALGILEMPPGKDEANLTYVRGAA